VVLTTITAALALLLLTGAGLDSAIVGNDVSPAPNTALRTTIRIGEPGL
jgi:hypothetical protein